MSAEHMQDLEDEDMDMMGLEDDSRPLFWSMKLEPNQSQEIDQPAIEGYIVHVTNACFGPSVAKGSRTVVMVNPSAEQDDDSQEAPICVLRAGQKENQSLDLLFNESATITVKGQKPSTVYLTGYLQPPIEPEADMMDPAMMEDMDDEDIQRMLAMQRKQQQALDDEDDDEGEPELMDEAEVEPPTKKQKTTSGAKSTKNGSNTESQKKRKSPQQKPKKSPQQKPTPSPLASDDKKEDDKKQQTKKGKKDKKMQTMKGGIKFRDMKVGDGKNVSHGDKLTVYYVGQTDDKKVFDKCISGTGFEFNFGKGDVIKGWDMGLKGMRVGGKRKLVIPSKLAYGANGSPPSIPPNATLTFTIELKKAN